MTQVMEKAMEDEVIRWATFRLCRERYGVNVMQVREVLRYSEITPVPGTSDYVLGIINLRGNVVTVLDTRNLFNLENGKISDHSRIVIIEACDQVVGMLVDSVDEVVDVKLSDIDTTPSTSSDEAQRYFMGVCNYLDELLILVDVHQLVGEKMKERMQQAEYF